MCNIVIQFSISAKLVRLIKMCLNKSCSRVRVDKHLSDMFPIKNGLKQGDALSRLFFNFALEYTIRRVQVNRDGLKLNGTHQPLVYVDGVNTVGVSVRTCTIKKITEALVVASHEIGLEVNADKIKYMVISRDLNARRCQNIKIDNNFLERVEEFRYLETALTNQNSIQEEIKSRLKPGNACYHSVQNLLSSILLSKGIMIKIYRTVILSVFCMGVESGRSH